MGRTIVIVMTLIGIAGTALAEQSSSCPSNSRKKSDGSCVCNDGYAKRYGRCERPRETTGKD